MASSGGTRGKLPPVVSSLFSIKAAHLKRWYQRHGAGSKGQGADGARGRVIGYQFWNVQASRLRPRLRTRQARLPLQAIGNQRSEVRSQRAAGRGRQSSIKKALGTSASTTDPRSEKGLGYGVKGCTPHAAEDRESSTSTSTSMSRSRSRSRRMRGPNVYHCASPTERQAGALALQWDFRSSILSCSMLRAPCFVTTK